jgi:hypothetical protein
MNNVTFSNISNFARLRSFSYLEGRSSFCHFWYKGFFFNCSIYCFTAKMTHHFVVIQDICSLIPAYYSIAGGDKKNYDGISSRPFQTALKFRISNCWRSSFKWYSRKLFISIQTGIAAYIYSSKFCLGPDFCMHNNVCNFLSILHQCLYVNQIDI